MRRTGVKKVVLAIAAASLAAAILTLGAAIWAVGTLGSAHVATPSLFATTFFFVCCAVVLYVMSLMPKHPPAEGGDGSP